MRQLVNSEATQHIPVVGICFGHQIMSLALGGKCEQGTNGWEIGVYANSFTKEGRFWWSDSVVPNGDDKIVSGLKNGQLTPVYAANAQGCGD